jgi:hypothetical protein
MPRSGSRRTNATLKIMRSYVFRALPEAFIRIGRRQPARPDENLHYARPSQRDLPKSVFCIRIRISIQMISGIQIWICTWKADPEMQTVQTQHFSNMTAKSDFGGQEASCGTGDKIGCPKREYSFPNTFQELIFHIRVWFRVPYRKRQSFLWTPSDSDFSTITNMQCCGSKIIWSAS